MELWIARDFEGDIYAYGRKPDKHDKVFHSDTNECIKLNIYSFPEVTYENSPRKVKIELV